MVLMHGVLLGEHVRDEIMRHGPSPGSTSSRFVVLEGKVHAGKGGQCNTVGRKDCHAPMILQKIPGTSWT
eukprot:1159291-Pelagomonas_calceolata.AAC.2